jgi:magnesium and cobalt transporter
MNDPDSKPSLLDRLSTLLLREPEDREQLLDLLRGAFERNLLDGDALSIIEGALQVSDMQVRDVMVPRPDGRAQRCRLMAKITGFVIEATHSRYPVGENRDDVIGILAWRTAELPRRQGVDLRDTLRPAVFILSRVERVVA